MWLAAQEVGNLKAALQEAEQRIGALRTSYEQEKAKAEVVVFPCNLKTLCAVHKVAAGAAD